ncbi:hypothetical protein BJX68DRAFT_270950 [Aspergillus pseudodeflectus]|uniref:LysM domain-containing protein n=1 Tax=Aspergillus pseudodeflectus TaxID=176178 RepID=A0ABR4JP10_9EURO
MAFSRVAVWQVTLLCLSSLVASWQAFPGDTVDAYDDKCADALATNLTACIPAVRGLSSNNFYSEHGLDLICTSECRDELKAYEKTVTEGCPEVTYTNEWGTELPISEIASTLAFEFQQTCLQSEGQYCNIVLGNITQHGGDECNKCLLLKLRSEAQYPYGSGPDVYSSVYPSFTSSCGFTGYPVTVTPTPVPSSTPSASSSAIPTATSTSCAGTTYKIQPNDTCNSISLGQNIATFQLLLDNRLQAYCANFPSTGTLCIKNTCTVYTVEPGDTCKSVAKAHGISPVQLRSYNPWIDRGCYNFNRTVGTQICLDEPGDKYHPPLTAIGSSTSPATATAAVPVPTNVADNTTRSCGEFYTVVAGDNCTSVAERFGIPRADFLILNPGLNEQCTNLLLGISYCVLPVGDMSNYPGGSGYIPTISQIPWTDLPDATYTPIFNPDVSKIAPGTTTDCASYVEGKDLQFGFPGVSDCEVVQSFFEVSAADLLKWNPSLKALNGNSTSCGFSEDFRYCLAGGTGGSGTGTGSATASPTSTPDPTSASIPSTSSSTSAPSTETTTAEPTKTPTPTATPTRTATDATSTNPTSTTTNPSSIPSPTQSDSIPSNCTSYAKAVQGDNCVDFAKAHGITPEELYEWNTVLGEGGKECGMMFQAETHSRVNGTYTSESPYLIQGILRNERGFKGLVMSDSVGTYSTAAAMNAGLDLEMPGPTIS